MKTYALHLESGPKHMKTMVHVPELLGCVATGPTTEAALQATPDAIRSFLGFMHTGGERVDPDAAFKTKVVEHVTEGAWRGNGSPYANFTFDLEPVTPNQIEALLRRFHSLREALASWAESATDKKLDAAMDPRRTPRSVLVHLVPGPGSYLSPVVGGVKGFSSLASAVERGEVSIADGYRRAEAMAAAIVRETTPAQRKAVIQRPKEIRTLRKALRRMLEHDWEHLYELSRVRGGPSW